MTSTDEAVSESSEDRTNARGLIPGNMAIASVPADGNAREHAASETADEDIRGIHEALHELLCKTEDVVGGLEESNRLGEERERVVDRLHEEVQKLRAGELHQAMSPVFRDLVKMIDQLDRTVRPSASRPALTIDEATRDLVACRDDLVDLLYRHGIEPYDAVAGTRFDPKEHRALATIVTLDPAQDATIARVLRVGFRSDIRVLRQLEAEVYRTVDVTVQSDRIGEISAPRR